MVSVRMPNVEFCVSQLRKLDQKCVNRCPLLVWRVNASP